jgi:hypothetical protein
MDWQHAELGTGPIVVSGSVKHLRLNPQPPSIRNRGSIVESSEISNRRFWRF